ncbi:hypothetical protein GCM10015535_67260 [Streptomyces gelaticus]|uniref:Uncharacterized protein n=1 Tax=Streptomyces gelaticus TaxID=285446 RepID=A0ABQ2W9K9_9ACTN|nr:hypothetical protein GCM10015535_67260 [Streptomyces gelaticus]
MLYTGGIKAAQIATAPCKVAPAAANPAERRVPTDSVSVFVVRWVVRFSHERDQRQHAPLKGGGK